MGLDPENPRQQEIERTLAEKDRVIQDLWQRLRKAEHALEHVDRQRSRLNREAKKRSRDLKNLTRWAERMDTGASAILSSRRWKIGSFLGDLSRVASSNQGEPQAVDLVRKASKRFRAWKRSWAQESPEPPLDEDRRAYAVAGRGRASQKPGPDQPNGIKRVQVGCGPHNLMADWWNVDIKRFAGLDAVMDATKPWPYEDLEYVFGEHFLEHLTLDGAIEFLEHAGNSLRIGGMLRLSTPNLEWVLNTHYPSAQADAADLISATLRMNRAFHGWGHHFLYSEHMLAHVLRQMGFEAVSFFSYGESDTPALRNLEHHGGFSMEDGRPSVIIAEATRGERPISPSADLITLVQDNYLRYVRTRAH